MQWPSTSKKAMKRDKCKVNPKIDKFTSNVCTIVGFIAFYRMFVDNGLTAAPRIGCNRQLIAASIEACYLLLGYPGPIKNPFLPPSMAWDKMHNRPIGIDCVSLGVSFLSKWLEITINNCKVEWLLLLLTKSWNNKKRSFICIDAACLIGNVLACAQVCQGLQWSLHHLVEEMKKLLRRNAFQLAQLPHFRSIPGEKDEQWLDQGGKIFAQFSIIDRLFLNKVWNCKATAFITIAIREEIAYIIVQCNEYLNGTKPWQRPISHIVKRRPNASGWQDASTKLGMGRNCYILRYLRQLKWSDINQQILLHIRNKNLHINMLELAAIIVNFITMVVGFT